MTRQGSLLIAFAGVDGSGKTTQALLVADWLRSCELNVLYLPNESLRDSRAMLDRVACRNGFQSHVHMLGPDVARLIAAILKWWSLRELAGLLAVPGTIVVMDRSVVCQYAAARVLGCSNEGIVRDILGDLPVPDVTILVDVPAEMAANRVVRRGIDTHTRLELHHLREAYRSLPEYQSFQKVDGTGSVAAVHENIRAVLRTQLHVPLPERKA